MTVAARHIINNRMKVDERVVFDGVLIPQRSALRIIFRV